MFSMPPSILAFNLIKFKGILLATLGKKICYFEGWGQVEIVLGSTHIVQQLLFTLFPSILALDFDLILGLFFFIFGALIGYFWVQCGVKKLL